MSRREKMIVAVMAAAVLLGGYLYFVPGTKLGRQGVQSPSDTPALDIAQQIIGKLKEDVSLDRDLYTIRSAESQWAKDPFLKTGPLLSDTQTRNTPGAAPATADTPLNLAYTGFLEAGSQRLAIINGMEYEAGEAIDSRGYYVRRIQPHQVEIRKRNAPDVIVLKLTE